MPSWKTLLKAVSKVDQSLFEKLAKEHQTLGMYVCIVSMCMLISVIKILSAAINGRLHMGCLWFVVMGNTAAYNIVHSEHRSDHSTEGGATYCCIVS